LGLDWGEFEVARDRLIELKLIAFRAYSARTPNGHYQVLPVDGGPPNVRSESRQPIHRGSVKREELDPVAWARS
jgi:hypothetical protein